MWADSVSSERLAKALQLAMRLHEGQLRKGTTVPYISHSMAVASLVAEDEGCEDEVIAGLLHDAAEDQGGEETLQLIELQLGSVVAAIVRDCSDSLLPKGAEKRPWHERKLDAISRLSSVSEGALRVVAADKLHNTRATAADRMLVGESVWNRFKTGKAGFVWYHEQVLAVLSQRLPESRSVRLLSDELSRLTSPAAGAR